MLVKIKRFKTLVSLVDNIEGVLVDSTGTRWVRDPQYDEKDVSAAFSPETDGVDLRVMHLDRHQLKRVCQGAKAIRALTTVDEVRWYATEHYAEWGHETDGWNNQQIRELMIEADETGKNLADLVERKARAQIAVAHAMEEEAESHGEATEKPEETPVSATPAKSPSRKRTQEKAKRARFAGVELTEKQVAFLRGLPCKELYTANDAPEGFSKMSIGAMISTLREKGVVTTKKVSGARANASVFLFTDEGKKVFEEVRA